MLRIGLCGAGFVAQPHPHSHSRQPGVEKVRTVGPRIDHAKRLAAKFGATAPAEFDALLVDDIEAISICTPTPTHAELAIKAMWAGKNVLCEKLIATTIDDATRMIAVCDAAGVQLHVPFGLRFFPMVQRAKQLIAAVELGSIYGMIGGNRGIPPLPPAYPEWITDPVETGGGALMDHSVHVIDVIVPSYVQRGQL